MRRLGTAHQILFASNRKWWAVPTLHNFQLPTAATLRDQACESVFRNGTASLCNQPLVVRQVMHRHEHGPKHFARLKQVAQIPTTMTTSGAWARRIERLTIHGVLLITQPNLA